MTLYIKVTSDEYELPLAVGDTVRELAKMLGVKSDSIYSQMSHSKHNGYFCSYQKVEVDDEDESDS
jgi:hypothetical protein